MGENTMKVAFGLNFVHFDFTHQIVFMKIRYARIWVKMGENG